MNVELRSPQRARTAGVGIVDCDIHPRTSLEDDIAHWTPIVQGLGLKID